MSIFKAGYQSATGGGDGPSVFENIVRKTWPVSADVLFGCFDEASGDLVVPRHKVLYWAEGEFLKYCLSSPQTKLVAFGSVPASDVRLGMLERSLTAEDFEWKPKKGR